MLYVLIVAILILIIAAYIVTKDVLSPSLLLCAVFFLSVLCAIMGNRAWQVDVSVNVVLVVGGGLFCIFLGEIVGRFICTQPKLSRQITSNGALWETKIITHEERLNGKKGERIAYSPAFILCLSLLMAGCLVIYYLHLKEIALAAEQDIGKGMLLQVVRLALQIGGYSINPIVAVLMYFIRGFGYVGLAVFMHNVFFEKTLKQGLKRNWTLLLPIIGLVVSNVLSTARNGFIMLIVVVFFLAIDQIRCRKKIKILYVGLAGLALVVAFFILFLILGSMKGQTSDPLSLIWMYAGSSITAFDTWLVQGTRNTQIFVGESLYGLHSLLARFIPSYSVPSLFSEFVTFPNGEETNIYTGFRAWINDFGMLGCMGVSFIIGVVFGMVYIRAVYKKKNRNTTLYKLIYAYFFYGLLYSFATPELTTSLFSITQIFDLLFICLSYYVVLNIDVKRRRKQ